MSKKQILLESFFENEERLSDETVGNSKAADKKKAVFKRKYQESCLNWASQVVLVVKNLVPMQEAWEPQIQSLSREDPLEEAMVTIPVFLPRQSHGQRSQAGYGL